MNDLTVGQKRKTIFAAAWHTSEFFTADAKRILRTENTFFRLCTSSAIAYTVCLCFVFLIVSTNVFFSKTGIHTLSVHAHKLLYCGILAILLLIGGFFAYGALCGLLKSCTPNNCDNAFSVFTSQKNLQTVFRGYIVNLIALMPVLTLATLTVSVLTDMRGFSIQSGIFCGIMILTCLYLLCIIRCVLTVYEYIIFASGTLADALRLCSGHFGEYICLCIRTIPHVFLGIASAGVLFVFYTLPHISSCKYAFASYLCDLQAINDNKKGINIDGK